jgi:hypothetical protein
MGSSVEQRVYITNFLDVVLARETCLIFNVRSVTRFWKNWVGRTDSDYILVKRENHVSAHCVFYSISLLLPLVDIPRADKNITATASVYKATSTHVEGQSECPHMTK